MTNQRNETHHRMAMAGVAVVGLVVCAACTATSGQSATPGGAASPASSTSGPSAGAAALDCSDPIDTLPEPASTHSSVLGVVALQTTSTVQANESDDGAQPHRLFAKTGLLVRAGREGTLTVPAAWSGKLSIAWGNHPAEWTTSLRIPMCPTTSGGGGQWLAYPGGYSLDEPACVPLEVDAGTTVKTVHIALGVPCPP